MKELVATVLSYIIVSTGAGVCLGLIGAFTYFTFKLLTGL